LALRTTASMSFRTISPRYSSDPLDVTARSIRPSRAETVAHHSSICSRVNVAVVPVSRMPSGSCTMSHIASASSARTGRSRIISPWSVGFSIGTSS
jgi:hypothetical protein